MHSKSPTSTLPNRLPLPRQSRAGVLGVVLKALSIWRERQVLHDLDDHMLRDIGVSRNDADVETNRPVWDAPNRWMR